MTTDTLTITRQLVAAGFDRQEAEAVPDPFPWWLPVRLS